MAASLFPELIAPLSIEEFYGDYFERRHLFLPATDCARYTALVSIEWLDAYVDAHRPLYTQVFAIDARRKIPSEEFTGRDGRVDPVRLYQLFAGGATLVYRDLQERLLALARLCQSAEKIYSCPFFVNAFLSPPQAQCFPIHHDCNDVFALQISGSKRWELYSPLFELPLADQGTYQALTPDSAPEPGVLNRGDLLYIPRGFPHLVYATDAPSLHLSLSSYPYTWTDVMTRAMAALCRGDAAFRESLPRSFRDDPGAADLRSRFAELAQRFAALADGESALAALAEEFVRSRPVILPGQRAQLDAADRLTIDSELGGRPDLIYVLTKNDAELRLVCHDTEIRLPVQAMTELRFALETARFRIRDMPGELAPADRLLLVATLMRQGLVCAWEA